MDRDTQNKIKSLLEIGESLNYYKIEPNHKTYQINRVVSILDDHEKFKKEEANFDSDEELLELEASDELKHHYLELDILAFLKKFKLFNPKTQSVLTKKAVEITSSSTPLFTFCKLDLIPKLGDLQFFSVIKSFVNVDIKYIERYRILDNLSQKLRQKEVFDDDFNYTDEWKYYFELEYKYESEFDLEKAISEETGIAEDEVRGILSYEYLIHIDKSVLSELIEYYQKEKNLSQEYNISNTDINILEEHLEQIIRRNFSAFFPGLKIIDNQHQHRTIQGDYVDILAQDDNGNYIVIELKKGRSPQKALAQLLDYMHQISNEYKTEKVQGILVSRNIDKRTRSAFDYLTNNLRNRGSVSLKEFRFDIEIE